MARTIQQPFGQQHEHGQRHIAYSDPRGHFVGKWAKQDDELLRRMIEDEKRTFREAAFALGRTRDACIGRHHRLLGKYQDYERNRRRN